MSGLSGSCKKTKVIKTGRGKGAMIPENDKNTHKHIKSERSKTYQ